MENSILEEINRIKDEKSKKELLEIIDEIDKCKDYINKCKLYGIDSNACPITKEASDFVINIERKYSYEIGLYNLVMGIRTSNSNDKKIIKCKSLCQCLNFLQYLLYSKILDETRKELSKKN